MSKENTQYLIDRIKQFVYKKVTGINKNAKTGMQNVLLQLKVKKLLPNKINAIEMFGMHGLWHTMDYIDFVDNLDMFEINKRYHELSKIMLRRYPVQFYNQDSIDYISKTKDKYNFIVADIPYSGQFYKDSGLPYFFDDMTRISEGESIIVFNFHSQKLDKFSDIKAEIHNKIKEREIRDLFFIARNELISYVVLALR